MANNLVFQTNNNIGNKECTKSYYIGKGTYQEYSWQLLFHEYILPVNLTSFAFKTHNSLYGCLRT